MKFWQLVSICKELKLEIAHTDPGSEADQLARWYQDFDAIVNSQDRSILDHEISNELCLQIIQESDQKFYVSNGYLRKRPLKDDDQTISVKEIVRKFGGSILEELMESGLVNISPEG